MIRRSPSVSIVYLIYLLAIAMTTALLVFWVLVVQRFKPEINQMMSRLGVEWNHFHWFIHSTGAGLIFLVLVALTFLLAVSLSELRYSKKRDDLLSNVTHDLKTPVAAIKLHAQTLQQSFPPSIPPGGRSFPPSIPPGGRSFPPSIPPGGWSLPPSISEELGESIGYIVRESERISNLVDDLLESSRLQAGTELGLRPIHLGEFFREYQKAVKGRFDLSRVDINFEIRTRAVVMATTETLQRVMDNLIDNALRVTEGTKGGEVLCRVTDGLESAQIVVADNGMGIPKRELGKIFDRFYQLGKSARGSGLGLSIVRGLVEDMRGKIRAVSGDGKPGTRFEIRLPQADPDEMSSEATSKTV